MRRSSILCLLAIPLLASGCHITVEGVNGALAPSSYDAQTEVTLEDLEERISASRSIANLNDRDSALATVAMDAAASGHADKCEEALTQIGNLAERDAAAAESARLAMEHSTLADARAIAATIRTIPLRDSVYGQIARGVR